MRRIGWAALLFLLWVLPVHAQTNILGEAEFWQRLKQTDDLLVDASQLNRIHDLWTGVDAVMLSSGATVQVDLRWITTANDSVALRSRVRALLEEHARSSTIPANSDQPLGALEQVLKDPQFQYNQTPTPWPEDDISLPNLPAIPAELSQLLLVVVGIGAVIAIVVYFARGLQMQRAALEMPSPDDDPTTSNEAHDRAAEAECARDYRSAVRYLYLACLLLLDERGLLRYDPALTNREHLLRAASQPQLADLLRPVVNTFDRVWYGFAPVDDALYQEFRQRVERLGQL
jgi:hypothetical protein